MKCAIVTGAAVRLGKAISLELHNCGYRIAVHFNTSVHDASALVQLLNERRPGSAEMFSGDLEDEDFSRLLPVMVAERFGRIDALVNNASSYFKTPIGSIDYDSWNNLINTNMKAPLFLSQACVPFLKAKAGSIVNITDIHAEFPARNYPVYSAAKAGLLGLTRALAIELAPEVRVNAVAPGAIKWPEGNIFSEKEKEKIIRNTLLKRTGVPDDVAKTVRFLVADAPYITGQVINVDGGRTLSIDAD